MKRIYLYKIVQLTFSRWSRKGYAVLLSMGRVVRIARLALHICASSLLKSARKGLIVNEDKCSELVIKVACDRLRKQCLLALFMGKVCPDGNKIIVII